MGSNFLRRACRTKIFGGIIGLNLII